MNTFKQILVFLTLVTFVAAQDLSELRQWTSTSGSQLEAKLVSLDVTKGTVKLMTADGKEFNIVIDFSSRHRDLLKKWHKPTRQKFQNLLPHRCSICCTKAKQRRQQK